MNRLSRRRPGDGKQWSIRSIRPRQCAPRLGFAFASVGRLRQSLNDDGMPKVRVARERPTCGGVVRAEGWGRVTHRTVRAHPIHREPV